MGSFKPRNISTNRSHGGFHDDHPKRFSRPAPRPRGRNSDRFDYRDSDRLERRDSGSSFEKNMFAATCAKCSAHCEVPFKPTNNKPVYCSDCFRKNDNYKPERSAPSKNEFEQINKKLDKIMKALDIESFE